MTSKYTVDSPWYRSLNRAQWKALVASNLGWTFDGFEVFALILTIGAALHQLLDPSEYKYISFYAGAVIAITVFGWGAGGLLGGILADYIGRKRSMTLTILAYSLLTGLSALSWDWLSFAVLRFLVGLAIGSEWATGATITAELWPDKARGKGGAFLQCGLPIGSILASAIWVIIGTSGPGAWRYMYLIGVLPALLVFWIRRNIPESPRWEESNRRRRAAHDLRRQGAALKGEDAALVRFTLVDMFVEPAVRMRLLLTFVMSLSITIGFWGVSSFVPSYFGSVATAAGLPAQRWVGLVGLVQNIGALLGFFSFGFLADALGRKPTTFLYYLMCLILTPIVYLWVQEIHLLLLVFAVYGFFIGGVFSWTPIWLPELFPTRMRATAAGFIFNAPRLISAITPLIAGTLIVGLGGYGKAATIIGLFYILGLIAVPFLPETKGKPLHLILGMNRERAMTTTFNAAATKTVGVNATNFEFTFTRLERIAFGPGKITTLGAALERMGATRALVATGKTLGASPLLERVTAAMGPHCVGVFAGVGQHVPASSVRALVAEAERVGADALVALGGGSPIDACKVAAASLLNRRDMTLVAGEIDFDGAGREIRLVAVPTTLSAGEFTPGGAVTDEATRVKRRVGDARLQHRTVIYDPELCLDTPDWLWVSTGMRALDHAIEGIYSTRAQPFTDTLGAEAIRLMMAHLPGSVGGGSDRLAERGWCQIAAWHSYFGGFRTGMGVSHALGHEIGPHWDVPHGVTSCITLPHVMRFMADVAPQRFRRIAEALDVPFDDPRAAALASADKVAAFIAGFDVPHSLKAAGVERAEIHDIAEAVADEVAHEKIVERPVTVNEIKGLLDAAYE